MKYKVNIVYSIQYAGYIEYSMIYCENCVCVLYIVCAI